LTVEIFDYYGMSHVSSSNSHRATIIAYDKHHDIAILKLETPKEAPYVAKLLPKEKIDDVKIRSGVYASGCSLGHDPFPNAGIITYLDEEIENKLYWMTNADSIFGNSGGSVFLAETGEQIGITAMLTSIQLGFGIDVQTWMNFCVPIIRIYQFIDEQELKFLYDDADTFEKAMKRREKKQNEALLAVAKAEERGEDTDVSDETSQEKTGAFFLGNDDTLTIKLDGFDNTIAPYRMGR